MNYSINSKKNSESHAWGPKLKRCFAIPCYNFFLGKIFPGLLLWFLNSLDNFWYHIKKILNSIDSSWSHGVFHFSERSFRILWFSSETKKRFPGLKFFFINSKDISRRRVLFYQLKNHSWSHVTFSKFKRLFLIISYSFKSHQIIPDLMFYFISSKEVSGS